MESQQLSSRSQKAPKPRNSELRKEQNRVASRAYREKRKQKLALLDEILKTEQDSTTSSQYDDTEDTMSNLSITSHHHEPCSLKPSTNAVTQQWASTLPQAMALPTISDQDYSCHRSSWGYDPHAVPVESDLLQDYMASDDITSHCYGGPAQLNFPVLDVSVSVVSGTQLASSVADLQDHFLLRAPGSAPTLPYYDEPCPRGDPGVIAALESFSRLDDMQQQQMLGVIHRSRSSSRSHGSGHSQSSTAEHHYNYKTQS